MNEVRQTPSIKDLILARFDQLRATTKKNPWDGLRGLLDFNIKMGSLDQSYAEGESLDQDQQRTVLEENGSSVEDLQVSPVVVPEKDEPVDSQPTVPQGEDIVVDPTNAGSAEEVPQDATKLGFEQVDAPLYSENSLQTERTPISSEELATLLGTGYEFNANRVWRDAVPNTEIITIKKSAEANTTPDLPVLLIKEISLTIGEYIDLGFTRDQAEQLRELKVTTSALITNFKDVLPERRNDGIKKAAEAQEVSDMIAEFANIGCSSHINPGLEKKFSMVGHTILHSQRQETDKSGDSRTHSVQELIFEKLKVNPRLTLVVGHGGPDTSKEPMMERKKIVGSRFIGVDLDAGDVLRVLEQTGQLDQHVVIDTTCSGEPAAPGVLPEELLDPHSTIGFDVISPMANIGGKYIAQSEAYWLHKSEGSESKPGSVSFTGFKG